MSTIKLLLGGRAFEVKRLTIRDDGVWRRRAKPLVDPVAELAMAAGIANPTPDKMVRLAFTSALFIDPQETLDVVLAYGAELDGEREWIETHAYPEDALQALFTLFFGIQALPSKTNGAAPTQRETT